MVDSLRRVVHRACLVGLAVPTVLAGAAAQSGASPDGEPSSDVRSSAASHDSTVHPAMLVASVAQQPRTAVGHLTLRNSTRADIRVEVRTGTGPSCNALNAGPVRVIPPGKRWLIVSSRSVCWRRALDLALPVTAWAPWQRHVLTAGERLEATP